MGEPQLQQRLWAVLALQRLYLFSDASEVEPVDAVDLKDTSALSVIDDAAARERFGAELRRRARRGKLRCSCFTAVENPELLDAEGRSFEVFQLASAGEARILKKLSKPRSRLVLV